MMELHTMIPVSVAPVFRIAATDEVPQISGPTPQRWAHDWALGDMFKHLGQGKKRHEDERSILFSLIK
jgi:hypothetical protein